MRNIWRIFTRDLRNLRHNVIGLIVVVGLIVVPPLYAWFNIAGGWDPYGNTGGMKVAVANADEGYKSDLIPIEVNLGDTVISQLRANDQLDWQFVDKDEAIEGVKSGAYYAAVVIPKDFSADMMTLFSTEVKHSKIIYYENQKKSAVAPEVTSQGASTSRRRWTRRLPRLSATWAFRLLLVSWISWTAIRWRTTLRTCREPWTPAHRAWRTRRAAWGRSARSWARPQAW